MTDATKRDETMKMLAGMHHDLLVVMQTALIEWRHGKGVDAAFEWLENTLDGPGLLPDHDGPYGKEAQAYFDTNRYEPYPTCFCGRPSNQLWMGQGFCSEAHFAEKYAASLS